MDSNINLKEIINELSNVEDSVDIKLDLKLSGETAKVFNSFYIIYNNQFGISEEQFLKYMVMCGLNSQINLTRKV